MLNHTFIAAMELINKIKICRVLTASSPQSCHSQVRSGVALSTASKFLTMKELIKQNKKQTKQNKKHNNNNFIQTSSSDVQCSVSDCSSV